MKKFLLFLNCGVGVGLVWGAALGGSYLYSYCFESRLFVNEARREGSNQDVHVSAFRQGSLSVRFSMAASLVAQQYGVGQAKEQIINDLGSFDESILPASRWYEKGGGGYKLQDFNNPWYLVFYFDEGWVRSVQIEKSHLAPDMLYRRVAAKLREPLWNIAFALVSIKHNWARMKLF